ncbi:hypothetical protein GCM10025868_45150 [Angustibacter aerolatus]|uniref:DUF222 domain-containing protein n=1 Tax=Angustibacter aerolatus TaxID=1162965 RepID=A0ABQ6JLV9_9ACTN|nr:hypothetical protein [Angustibacter aerolatus]GMA89265.1 hypothetical protein GCM10025868_45150 [Angustibacter aerolatus]
MEGLLRDPDLLGAGEDDDDLTDLHLLDLRDPADPTRLDDPVLLAEAVQRATDRADASAQALRAAEHALAVARQAAGSLADLSAEPAGARRGARRPAGSVRAGRRASPAASTAPAAATSLRMRLSSFVLAARLEEVAAAASERLLAMSDGRFALVHSDERGRGGGRSGLALHALDGWTGVARETSTLSGGESFLASSPSRSAWPTSCGRRPAAPRSRRCSSTKASACSTPTPSTR